MISWRGGSVEFARRQSNGRTLTACARPPWYVIRYSGGYWDRDDCHYIWVDYGGPPKVFLTRKHAEAEAHSFRNKYGRRSDYGNGPLKVDVVKLVPPLS